jgi:glutamate N-acetyltransferase/amino-acid N-acetyltransferase
MIVADGEGATKVVEVAVRGAKSDRAAKGLAYGIATSPLVKTSFFGQDPNWGRVICALGNAGEDFNPEQVDIFYGGVALLRQGRPVRRPRGDLVEKIMKKPMFTIRVELHQGSGAGRIYTSDLTYEYVRINAEYST